LRSSSIKKNLLYLPAKSYILFIKCDGKKVNKFVLWKMEERVFFLRTTKNKPHKHCHSQPQSRIHSVSPAELSQIQPEELRNRLDASAAAGREKT
jgi:hypothetical protein